MNGERGVEGVRGVRGVVDSDVIDALLPLLGMGRIRLSSACSWTSMDSRLVESRLTLAADSKSRSRCASVHVSSTQSGVSNRLPVGEACEEEVESRTTRARSSKSKDSV